MFATLMVFIGLFFPSIVADIKDREGTFIVFVLQCLSLIPFSYQFVDNVTGGFLIMFTWFCTLLYAGMANTKGSYEKE
jgi:hypothetical protein